MKFPQNIRDGLIGCLEIPLFLKAGVARFDNSKRAMQFSFLIGMLVTIPAAWLARSNPDFAGTAYPNLLAGFITEYLIFSFLYLPTMYFITKELGRGEYFNRFVNGYNWLNISQLCMIAPMVIGVWAGHWLWEEVYYFLVFLVMYGYAFFAFYITWNFRVNWMLGTGLAILGMALSELTHFFVYG